MNFRKVFQTENTKGHNFLLLSGIILPVLIPLVFASVENTDVSDFWLYVITCFMIFWLLVLPSLCRLHYYSLYYYRLSISLSIVIPLLLSFILKSPEIVQRPITRGTPVKEIFERYNSISSYPPLDQLKVFVISAGIFWLIILISLWLYDGYLISKKAK
jgi:hypothetical protein